MSLIDRGAAPAHDTADGLPHPQFPRLFSGFDLGGLRLRNRLVLSPMGSRFAREGRPMPGDVAFYRARSEAGVGLIITGGTPVHPSGTLRNRAAFEAYNEQCLPAFAEFATAVRAGGARLIGQLYHRGRETMGDSDWAPWAPSPLAAPYDPQIPHEMTVAEIDEVVAGFGRSARHLVQSGFDGIEIHAAHGYLVAQFLSEHGNQRQDEYGGSPERRMRFILRIVEAIREQIGAAPPLGVRISAVEGAEIEGGIDLAFSQRLAETLANTGAVNYISVTLGVRGTYVKDMSVPVGPTVDLAARIREACGLPVIVGQRINHPPFAERVLAECKADLIGMARPFIADAQWVQKARERRLDEIRPCVACNQVCRSGIMGCLHNPSSGRELIWQPGVFDRAASRRRIVVVGGGPAGMEAAIVAASRGHDVVLFEAARALGGQVRTAALAPNRTEIDGVVAWRASELTRLGVDVRLGVRADEASVQAESPDAVVIATGAVPAPAGIEGGDLPHVIDVLRALDPDPDTRQRLDRARTAVVVDNGSGFWESCSVAEALATRGLSVHYLTPVRGFAEGLPFEEAPQLLARLRGLGVVLLPMQRVAWIDESGVTAFDAVASAATGVLKDVLLPADVVVCYSGKRVVDELAGPLRGAGLEVHTVGDCVAPRRINHATFEAHAIGRKL